MHDKAYFTVAAAVGAVVVLTLLNFCGVIMGKWVQDVLVILKLIGLALIVIAGLVWSQPEPSQSPTRPAAAAASASR